MDKAKHSPSARAQIPALEAGGGGELAPLALEDGWGLGLTQAQTGSRSSRRPLSLSSESFQGMQGLLG